MSLSDRRRSPRFPFHSRATLLLDDLSVNGTLVDVSFAGALFAVDQHLDLRVGTKCRLAIFHRQRQFKQDIAGAVANCDKHLFGIEFLKIGGAAESDLRLVIDMNLAPPRLLQRDLPALLR